MTTIAVIGTRGFPGIQGGVEKHSENLYPRMNGDVRLRVYRRKPYLSALSHHNYDHIEFVDERIEYPDTDGLILTKSKQACYLRFADCTPLIFYNPKIRIGAVSHAGWRGTAQKIGVKTVEKMGGNPKDIIAVIGPAIGLCCYEVSDDVRSTLLETVTDHNGLTDGKNVDLKGINARQLQEIGVEKIDICHYCTSCNNDLFYSYRRENGTQNRHFAFLMLS